MSKELFKIPEVKSPRLRWIEKHGIKVRATSRWEKGMEDELGEELFQFYASDGRGQWFGGDTEDNAIAALAVYRGKLLWFEEGMA